MTKYQLLKALEPFDDDIEVAFLDSNGFGYSGQIYYTLPPHEDDAKIIISTQRKPEGKCVELKV